MMTTSQVAMNIEPAHIKEPHRALTFLLAGNAHCTFRSHKTDVHFTYHVEANKKPTTATSPTHFVQVLTGPDHYEYLGCIFQGRVYAHGHRRSRISKDAKSALAFPWVWARLVAGRVPETCDVYHEGRCGRCGRRLTHPESIETGMGPECIKKAEGG
jgi:hypothetical protein